MNARVPTYGRLELRGDRWAIVGVPPHVAIKLKQVFPKIPKAQTKEFTLPNSPDICADICWFEKRYPLDADSETRNALNAGRTMFEEALAERERIFLPGWQPPPINGFRPGYELWDLQAQAREMLHRSNFNGKKLLFLGDTVGMGKTFTALGSVMGSEFLPAAVVAKTNLPIQWRDQFIGPATYMSAHVITGTKPYDLPPANIYIFKYSNIAGWADIAAEGIFKSFIADEAHELRRGTLAEKGKAAKVFAQNALLNLPMSGTPIFNYGDEVYNIVEGIFGAGVLGDEEEFHREWCYKYGDHWVVEDPDALGTYLREVGLFLRREREGRPVNAQVIEVDCDTQAAADSRALAEKLAMKTINGSFFEAGSAARELDALLRHDTGVAKARGVAAFVKMLLSQGVSVLLFGWHRAVYDIWLKELADFHPAMYTGSETTSQKEKSKRAFINGDTNLMILSLRSAEGIDGLQHRCHVEVFGEYDWTKAAHEQAIGRVDRPGQRADVIDVYYCHVEFGSDPTIISVHALKSSQARGITNPMAGTAEVFRDESRLKRLAQDYLTGLATP